MAISCKKETNRRPQPCYEGMQLLTSVHRFYHDGTYYTEQYQYDYNLRLTKVENRTQAGGMMSWLEYHYVNGRLADATLNSATKKVAEYKYSFGSTNQPVKLEYFEYDANNALKLILEQLYEYNSTGQVAKTTVNYFINSPSYYIVHTYSNGNMVGQKHFALPTGAPEAELAYEYDNKINPYYKQVGAALDNPRFYSKNNITKITNISSLGTGSTVELVNDYEYRNDNRPAKVYNTYTNGTRTLGMVYFY